MSEASYTLHIWPPKWNLQSLDPTCLAAVMYLQLTIPGKFKVVPCTNPDQSPNGQLPFLTHGHATIATFPSIVSFVTSLAKSSSASDVVDLDAFLTSSQRAERVALYAHVETRIADLVSHMFYGIDTNFWGLTNPAMASEMSIPQKYYVSSRIRESYRPRLEAAGLWSVSGAKEEKNGLFEKAKEKKPDYRATFTRAFEREKVIDKAKAALGVHANYLSRNQFFFGDRPTSLDVFLAAHILLMADPPFPDAVLQIHLIETYPGLVDHARRMQAAVARAPPYEHSTGSESLLSSLIPRPFIGRGKRTQIDPLDVQYRNRSLIFAAVALTMSTLYLYTTLSFVVSVGKDENEVDEDEDEENGSEETESEEEDAEEGSMPFAEDED